MMQDRLEILKNYKIKYRLLGHKKYLNYFAPKPGKMSTDYTAHVEVKEFSDQPLQIDRAEEWLIQNHLYIAPWTHFQTPLWAAAALICKHKTDSPVESIRVTWISELKSNIMRPQ